MHMPNHHAAGPAADARMLRAHVICNHPHAQAPRSWFEGRISAAALEGKTHITLQGLGTHLHQQLPPVPDIANVCSRKGRCCLHRWVHLQRGTSALYDLRRAACRALGRHGDPDNTLDAILCAVLGPVWTLPAIVQHVNGNAMTAAARGGTHLVDECSSIRAGSSLGRERAGRRLSMVGYGEQRRQWLLHRSWLRGPHSWCSSGWMEVPLNIPSAHESCRTTAV